MKKIILFLFILLAAGVSAHEFWLQPHRFIYTKGEKAIINFLVGENFQGENWSGNKTRIKSLNWYHWKTVTNIAELVSDNKGDSILWPLQMDGTMMVTYNSINSFIQLEAAKFNAYLEEDGLKEPAAYRKQHSQSDSMGRELYQRSVKTIFQVGKNFDNTFYRETNLPLDIIPLQNPYTLKPGDTLSVKILFQKQPLDNYKIRLWHKQQQLLASPELISNKEGIIRFPVTLTGTWMVSCVKMIHLENDSKADWQSYWGSCTWGYE